MNERIKLLAEECGAYFGAASKDYFGEEYPAFVTTDRMDIEKFAKLIVKECQMQNVITACSLELDANPFVDQITNHFGVK